jgi:hypothetical protein
MYSRTNSFNFRNSPELVSSYIQIPDNVESFDFDTNLIDECFVLKNIAGHIFKQTIKLLGYEINEICLTNYIIHVCNNYRQNYFHNFQHAVNVLQMTYLLLNKTGIIHKLKPTIVIACLIAALSHDVDHPGNTNSYEINSMSKYAKLYNDYSVLENHHCTLTFELIECTGLINCFDKATFREVRKTIIACILGTDMSKHIESSDKFASINFNNEFFSIEEQITIAACFIHYADLSNPIKSFENCFEWSKRISLEYYEQSIKEEVEGLPVLTFMKANDNISLCLNEIAFITKTLLPAWQLFVSKFTDKNLTDILDRINNSLSEWNELKKQYLSKSDLNEINYKF